MEFRLDDGQVELQQTVARFCADRFPLDGLAEREGAPVDRARLGASWRSIGRLRAAWSPRRRAAVGLGAVEAAIVFEQLGSHLVPGPAALDRPRRAVRRRRRRRASGSSAGSRPRSIDGGDAPSSSTPPTSTCCSSSTTTGRGPPHGRPPAARAAAGRSTRSPRSAGSSASADGDGRRRRRRGGATSGCSGTVLAAAMLVGVAARALGDRPRLRPRAAAVRRPDRLVPGGQAPAGRHVRARRASPGARPTPPPRCSTIPGGDDPAESAAAAKLLAGEAAIDERRHRGPGARRHGLHLGHAPNYLLKRAWVLEAASARPTTTPSHLGSTVVTTP